MKPFEGGLILLVEDNELVSWAVEEGLKQAGWLVLTVPTGETAIAELEQDAGRFAALLTDIHLPGAINGWDVARRCRELLPAMAVIYMTGHPLHSWSTSGVAGSTLLQKPFTDAQLNAALRHVAPPHGHSIRNLSIS